MYFLSHGESRVNWYTINTHILYILHRSEVRLFRRNKGIRERKEEKQEMVMGKKINKTHDIHPSKCHNETHCLM